MRSSRATTTSFSLSSPTILPSSRDISVANEDDWTFLKTLRKLPEAQQRQFVVTTATTARGPEQIAMIKAWIDEGAEWPDAVANDAPLAPPDPRAVRLNDALRRGDRATFTAVLAEFPASAKAKGAHGISPLMAATLYGGLASMQALLAVGADVNAPNEAGATALMWAVSDRAKTQLLIDRGAEVDTRSNDGRTALMIASGRQQSHEVVTLLLDKGANPSASGPALFGISNSLTEAAGTGDETLFRLLVARGADVANAGPFAIAIARMSGCDACAEMLLKASPPPFVSIVAGILAPPLGNARQTRVFVCARFRHTRPARSKHALTRPSNAPRRG